MNIVHEYIYERFTQDSDPIKDLGIGRPYLRKIWNTEFSKMRRQNPLETYKKLFSDKKSNEYMTAVTMGIFVTLEGLSDQYKLDDNSAYLKGIKYLRQHNYIKKIRSQAKEAKKQIKDYLNNNLHTNITIEI